MSSLSLTLALLVCVVGCLAEWSPNPVANPKSVVTSNKVRFTILTSAMIRIEYSPSSSFRDEASLAVLNRNLPLPSFSSSSSNGYLTITTESVELVYEENTGMFTSDNLNITVQIGNGSSTVWNMGCQPTGNLLGTVRTLDDVDGSIPLYCPAMTADDVYTNHCTLGVMSRDGWATYDDSESAVWDNDTNWRWFVSPTNNTSCDVSFENRIDCNPGDGNQADCEKKGCCYAPTAKQGIPWCFFSGPATTSYQDIYFLGHGHNYIQALQDFTKISGPIPTFPRYIFGPQYSRWHAFNEVDEVAIIESWYQALSIPLDVLVLDMDWHYTYNTGAPTCYPAVNGWTGYTWDKTLFPNPSRFLAWAHGKGLHITNNMHPAAGVQCMEEQYPPFAVAMGVNPNTSVSIPYEMQNKTYAENFFEIVLKPLSNQGEQDGIDYWWIDYQQGESTEAPGINPTFWVNYAFISAASWWGSSSRPLIMARWGGLGNHRLSTIGFSGDTTTSWNSLAFQPYFTSTASNVGFFWSHDLGGFGGQPDPELYVRWIQWGLFSNLLRTHCYGKQTGGGDTRDIWEYPAYYFNIMRAAFVLRSRLVPYIYTQHALSYTTSLGLLRPMYYFYPEQDEAYNVPGQYFFGDSFIVSPVVQPNSGQNVTEIEVWIPQGVWVEYNSGQTFIGPVLLLRNYTLDEIPSFVPAGAIIPMRSDVDSPAIGSAQQIPSLLRFDFFPQSTGSFSSVVIEDDGISTGYERGESTTTTITMEVTPDTVSIVVNPPEGSFVGQPYQRSYQLNLVGAWPAQAVQFNGNNIPYSDNYEEDYTKDFWTYDSTTLSLLINIGTPVSTSTSSIAKVIFSLSLQDNLLLSGYTRKLNRLQQCKDLLDDQWGTYYPSQYPNLLQAAGSGLNSDPSTIFSTLSNFSSLFSSSIAEVNSLNSTPEKFICLAFLQSA